MVLAAGEGKRMRSEIAKVLHTSGGRCLLSHAVRAVAALHPEHLAVVVGHHGDQVGATARQVGAELGQQVTVAVQCPLLGSGDAVACALAALPAGLTGPVVVTAGDVPMVETATLWSLFDAHVQAAAAVTVLTIASLFPDGYGRIVRDASGAFVRIVEDADATDAQHAIGEVNAGIYVFDATFLAENVHRLKSDNKQGERYITDLVAIAHSDHLVVHDLPCPDSAQLIGVNTPEQLIEVDEEMNRRTVQRWLDDGVTIPEPSSVRIDVSVVIGRGVVLHPHVRLRGSTVIGAGAAIGPDTTLTDYVVEDGVEIRSAQLVGPQRDSG